MFDQFRHIPNFVLGLLLSITICVFASAQSNPTSESSQVPFDTPAIQYGDLELSLGYFMMYEQAQLGQIQEQGEEERKAIIDRIIQDCIFEHEVAQLAEEQGFYQEPEYIITSRDMEYDWLSRFYAYHQFFTQFEADEEELQKLYEEKKEDFYQPARFSFRHIFFRTIDMPKEVQETAKENAQNALAQIRSGSDFVEVAKKYSDSDRKGTLIGPLYTREHKPDQAINQKLEETLLEMNPGDVSDIIPTEYGYEILKLVNLQKAGYQSIEEVKNRLTRQLRNEKLQEWQNDILAQHWDEAVEEYHPEVLLDENAEPNAVVFNVNGIEITKNDYDELKNSRVRRTSEMTDKEYQEEVVSNLKENIIFRYITAKRAKDLNYESIPAYQVYLNTQRTRWVYGVWWKKMIENYMEENPTTEEELREYYESNPNQFLKEPKIQAAEMSFNIPEHDEEDKYEIYSAQQEALEKANQALARLEEGEEFEKVAKDLSESDTAEQGGNLGVISRGVEGLPNRVVREALRLEEGKFSEEPVVGEERVYIVMNKKSLERESLPFEDENVQSRANRAVTSTKRTQFEAKYRQQLVEPENIEILFEDIYTFNPRFLEKIDLNPKKEEN